MMRLWSTLLIVVAVVMVIGVAGANADEPVVQRQEEIIATIKLINTKPNQLIHYFGWCSNKPDTCTYCAQAQDAKADSSQPISKQEAPALLTRSATPVEMPEGIAQIAPFDLDNSIIVKGSQAGIDKLKSIVYEFDRNHKRIAFDLRYFEIPPEAVEQLEKKLLKSTGNGKDSGSVCISADKKLLPSLGIPAFMMEFSSGSPLIAKERLVTEFTLPESAPVRGPDAEGKTVGFDASLRILPVVNADGSLTIDILVKEFLSRELSCKDTGEIEHVEAKLTLTKDDVILLFRNSRQKNMLVVLVPRVMDER